MWLLGNERTNLRTATNVLNKLEPSQASKWKEQSQGAHQSVQLIIRRLYLRRIRIQENRWKEHDLLDLVSLLIDHHPVAHIERVFNEQENDTRQYFLKASTNEPA